MKIFVNQNLNHKKHKKKKTNKKYQKKKKNAYSVSSFWYLYLWQHFSYGPFSNLHIWSVKLWCYWNAILLSPFIFSATIVGFYNNKKVQCSKTKTMQYKLGAVLVLVIFCIFKKFKNIHKKIKCNIYLRNFTLKLIFFKIVT